ncbi:hypothetical protein [Tenacibaculum finnmarkense]|uniref:hypothetical protein n=1 Tax=Tenacibaculum finnmarkense TaxID=2781243 RepID=UPI001E3B5614|nr:hypothetical protein [Tenacibaculum finnmarkense]MCD8402153.1 hypothetical protein [Tenacibaculum finnmarkense genomovar finnmarkense]
MDNIGEKATKFFGKKPIENIDANADSKSSKEDVFLFEFTGKFESFQEYIQHEEFVVKKLDKQSERILREKNAKLAFIFSSFWAIFIGIVILLKGFGFWGFKLSETAFLFIIGALTTSIFTFYLLVLKFLFDKGSVSK